MKALSREPGSPDQVFDELDKEFLEIVGNMSKQLGKVREESIKLSEMLTLSWCKGNELIARAQQHARTAREYK